MSVVELSNVASANAHVKERAGYQKILLVALSVIFLVGLLYCFCPPIDLSSQELQDSRKDLKEIQEQVNELQPKLETRIAELFTFLENFQINEEAYQNITDDNGVICAEIKAENRLILMHCQNLTLGSTNENAPFEKFFCLSSTRLTLLKNRLTSNDNPFKKVDDYKKIEFHDNCMTFINATLLMICAQQKTRLACHFTKDKDELEQELIEINASIEDDFEALWAEIDS